MNYTNELYHHGILGQKWGKRNGPPYPLKVADHSSSEKKAGWKKSLNKEVDTKTDTSYNSRKKLHLTDKQKKALLIGAATVAAIGTTVYLAKSGTLNSVVPKGKDAGLKVLENYGGANIDDIDLDRVHPADLPFDKISGHQDGPVSEMRVLTGLKDINPDNGKKNCIACVVTGYFRDLGYDVVAKVKDPDSEYFMGELISAFPDFKTNAISGAKDKAEVGSRIRNELSSQPNHSTGILLGHFSDDKIKMLKERGINLEGHAITWRNINGRLVFTDNQNHRIGDDVLSSLIEASDLNGMSWGRLDDLDIDQQIINIFCRNRR